MADIANALGVELEIYARDKETGQRFAPYGPVRPTNVIATSNSSVSVSGGKYPAYTSAAQGKQADQAVYEAVVQ